MNQNNPFGLFFSYWQITQYKIFDILSSQLNMRQFDHNYVPFFLSGKSLIDAWRSHWPFSLEDHHQDTLSNDGFVFMRSLFKELKQYNCERNTFFKSLVPVKTVLQVGKFCRIDFLQGKRSVLLRASECKCLCVCVCVCACECVRMCARAHRCVSSPAEKFFLQKHQRIHLFDD